MKTFMLLTALSVIILSGCSTSKSTADYDDVYSTTKKSSGTAASENDQTQVTSPDYYQESSETVSGLNPEEYETGEDVTYGNEPYLTTTETVTTPEGTNYITNNYYEGYGTDDYYDYSYASRIDRFYSPYMGYSYYAPYYSNYYDPWYWDSYWYRPSFYFGMSWGWGGMYYGYPYYSYYYPYNNYWYGYNNGYWNGYYDGYYGYGYNDYYGSNYYGHRGDRSGSSNSGPTTSKDISSVVQSGSQPNYFERTTPKLAENLTPGRTSTNSNEGAGRQSTNSKSNQNVLVVDPKSQPTTGRGSDLKVSGNQQDPIGRSNTNSVVESGKNVTEKMNSRSDVQDQSKGSGSSSRYTYKKPAVNSNASKEGYKPGQTIENNNSSRPSQKYTKPGTQSSSNGKVSSSQQGTNTGNQNRQTYSKPQSNSNNSYSRPSGYNSNSQPSRSSNNTYSQPSRTNTNSQPSNSSKSYSQPSRSSSSGSYSTPSRSSSSGSYSSPSRSSSSSGSSSRSSSSGGSSSGGSRGGRK